MPDLSTVAIVGAGLAGGQAAQTLRAEGFDGRIFLIGEEADRPYERPPLSKELLAGRMRPEQVFLRPESWYADNAVDLVLSARVSALDPSGSLTIDGGDVIEFDACLLATGGRPRRLRVPGADLAGVLTLRTLADSLDLRDRLLTKPCVVVVGAGFIGCEVASCARALGCDVTLLEVAPLPLGRVLGPDLGAFYRDLHAGNGVDVRLGEGVDRFEGAASVEAVVGSSGRRYACDVALVGVGIDPCVELALDAGLPCENGIVVDDACRTAAARVFAAGDVARHPNEFMGGMVRVEHFQNGQRQGAAAARSMLGRGRPYAEVPWFWSDQYDANLQMLGHPAADEAPVTRGSLADRSWIGLWTRAGRVTSAVAINRGAEISAARRLIERGVAVEPSRLADPAVELRELLRL